MNGEKGGTKRNTKLFAFFKEKEKRTILEEKDISKIGIEQIEKRSIKKC